MIESAKTPKVSVCVATYNQKDYIRQCLQSIVDQETDFDFEVIVGDDASTDGTADIVMEYADKYPELILPIIHKLNMGAVETIIHIYRLAKGKYIAHMDGDDFSLPGKLQVQVDALDANQDCVMCTHDVFVVNKNSKIISHSFLKHRAGVNDLSDLYKMLPFFAHSSKMFVNDSASSFYDGLTHESIDIEIHVEQAKKGNIYHIDQCFGGYRLLTGISSAGARINRIIPAAARRIYSEALKSCDSECDSNCIKKYYAKAILTYAYQSALYGRPADSREYAKESISIKTFSLVQVCVLLVSFIPFASLILSNAIKFCKDMRLRR